ncbi:nitrate reductase gamma subunit [Candidatus Magnetomorum sp. HK-1]|nr:nitrate reductase gamma subunit [Candidatus Magnetomorum sp. HK-1]
MSIFIYLLGYLAVIVFFVAVIYRIINYVKKPMHVRWELYPVAHEGKRAAHGGSYLEDVDWWQKDRKKSLIGELKVMIPEIFLLKAVWEHNRPLWLPTYSFHLGLYLLCGFLALLHISAFGQIFGCSESCIALMSPLTIIMGASGIILCLAGSIMLIHKRLVEPELRKYSGLDHYVNLALFIVSTSVALITWLFIDSQFIMARDFIVNMLKFNFTPVPNNIFGLQMILAFIVIAYIPLTHMSHFFMKYFLYHDIRWGDEPNVNNLKTQAHIGKVLNYPVSWSASHIAGHGKTTWAEVATFNPVAQPES